MPGAIWLFYWPHWGIERTMGGLYNTHLFQLLKSFYNLFLPSRQFVLFGISHQQRHRQSYGRVPSMSPIRTAFTTPILILNSPALVCNHRPCRISISKIYSGIGDIYTVYSFGSRCPIAKGIWAFFTMIALPPYPSTIVGVPVYCSGLP